jgi:hypothetical protein
MLFEIFALSFSGTLPQATTVGLTQLCHPISQVHQQT